MTVRARCRIFVTRRPLGAQPYPTAWRFLLQTRPRRAQLLSAFARGSSRPEIVSGRVRSDSRVAFLFTGQGAQYTAMGRDLYTSEPVFHDAFDQCALLLGEDLDRPLQEVVGYSTNQSCACQVFWTRPDSRSRRSSLSNTRWRRFGVRGASSPRQSSVTVWANTLAPVLRAHSVSKTHLVW